MGTFTWPPVGTYRWPPLGTFSWPRTACSFIEAGSRSDWHGRRGCARQNRDQGGHLPPTDRSGNPSITAIVYRTSSVSVWARGRDRRAARNHRCVHLGRTEPYCAGPGDGFGGCWRGDRCLQPVVSWLSLAQRRHWGSAPGRVVLDPRYPRLDDSL